MEIHDFVIKYNINELTFTKFPEAKNPDQCYGQAKHFALERWTKFRFKARLRRLVPVQRPPLFENEAAPASCCPLYAIRTSH